MPWRGPGEARGTAHVFTGRAASSAKAVGRGKPGSDTALGVASGKRSADRENQAKRRRERGARRPDPRAPRFAASLTFWTEVRRRRPGGHRTPPHPKHGSCVLARTQGFDGAATRNVNAPAKPSGSPGNREGGPTPPPPGPPRVWRPRNQRAVPRFTEKGGRTVTASRMGSGPPGRGHLWPGHWGQPGPHGEKPRDGAVGSGGARSVAVRDDRGSGRGDAWKPSAGGSVSGARVPFLPFEGARSRHGRTVPGCP